MVTAVNALFEHAEAHTNRAFNFSFKGQNPIPFYPVNAHGLKTELVVEDKTPKSLVFWQHFAEDETGKLKALSADGWRTDMAEACASAIVEILQLSLKGKAYFADRPQSQQRQAVLPSDIAILVNEKKEAQAIKEALLAKNLNSVYLSTRGSVLDTQVAKDVLFWLKAIAEPTNTSLIRNALGTQTLNKPFVELQRLINDESYIDAMVQQFSGYKQLWLSKDVLPMLRKFMLDFDIHDQLLKRKGGERMITDLLHIGEVLQQASMKLDGMENLISYYENAISAELKDEVEFNKPRLESDSDLIKVVTVHKSKGLQYPLVFLPYASKPAEVSRYQSFYPYHEDGELKASFDPAHAKKRLSEELEQEDIRKLYVGLTRAKYVTWVGVASNKQWQKSGLAYLLGITPKDQHVNSALLTLAHAQPDDIEISPLPMVNDLRYTPPQKPALGEALHAHEKIQQLWNTFSYSSIQYASQDSRIVAPRNVDDEPNNIDPKTSEQLSENQDDIAPLSLLDDGLAPAEEQKNHHTFHRGAKPGTFLHNILEWACKTGFKRVINEPELLRNHVKAQIDNVGWHEYEEVVYLWMYNVISKPLAFGAQSGSDNEAFALCELSLSVAEMEFWYSTHEADLLKIDALVQAHTLNGAPRSPAIPFAKLAATQSHQGSAKSLMSGIFKGFIDLSFEHQGKYYVLDYKSNFLGDSDEAYTYENMEASILEHRYDLQFVIYLVALHRLLKQRLPNYNYESDVGGCIYYFLRGYQSEGQGVYSAKPPLSLIEAVDAIFAGNDMPAFNADTPGALHPHAPVQNESPL
jgi:exodeoxyribonuclease V beta subunit